MECLVALAPHLVRLLNFLLKYFFFDFFFHLLAAWVLPLKFPKAYWTSFAILQLIGYAIIALGLPDSIRTVWYIVSFSVLPYCCWRGPRSLRIAVAVLLTVSELLIEVLAMAWYISPTGISVTQASPSIYETAMRFINTAAMTAIALFLRWLVRNVTPEDARRRWSTDAAEPYGREADPLATNSFTRFFILQLAVLTVLFITLFGVGAHAWALPMVVLAICITVLSIAADVATVLSLKRYLASERSRARAEMLAERLETHVQAARTIQAEGERAACFRHDQRNHLAVLAALIDEGEVDRARSYLAELRR